MQEYMLELENVTKEFPGVKALDQVNFTLLPGEVHVLMGENGAGKSTLMKIVDGLYSPDGGEMRLDGKKVTIHSPVEAMDHHIAMIHQELNSVMEMTVAENIFLGRELGKGLLYNRKAMNAKAVEALQELGLELNPDEKMKNLSVAKRQMVEIAKAISLDASIIIMDEPTSAISEKEVAALFKVVAMLQAKGTGIIYISHKMAEIFQIATRITVMRDGKTVGTYPASELDNEKLIALMVGRQLTNVFPPREEVPYGDVALEVKGLCAGKEVQDVSFSLRKGEILGFAGLMGAGRSEVAEAIFGIRKITAGTIEVGGKAVTIKTPKDAIAAGLALVTEDRKSSGLNLKTSVRKDMTIVALSQFCKMGQLIDHKAEAKAVAQGIEQLRVKTPSADQQIVNLSGGNQQKVILARWLMNTPDVVILDEPTRGIDVGAKYEIYTIIQQLAREGKAVIVISSEMPEIIGVCDRTVVMHEGRITGKLEHQDMTQEAIMTFASGIGV